MNRVLKKNPFKVVVTMLKMQCTVWTAAQRLKAVKDNTVHNEIEKRVFNQSFFMVLGRKEGFFILLETIWCFQVQPPQIKVCHWILCMKERVSFSFFLKFSFILCVCVFLACMYALHITCVQCTRRSEESIESPRTGATDGCEPPCVGGGIWTQVLWKSRKCS